MLGRGREDHEVGERAEEGEAVGLVDEQLVGIGEHRPGPSSASISRRRSVFPGLGKHARIIAGAGIGDLDILPRMTSAHAPSLRDALIVAAVAALLIVSPLGRHLIACSGEARIALLARDMIKHLVPFQAHVEGQLYRNKPPLYPWSIALASLPGGRVTAATAQVPVAIAGIATVVVTCLLGARLFGRRAGSGPGSRLTTGAARSRRSNQPSSSGFV